MIEGKLVRLREPKSEEHKLLVKWRNEASEFFFFSESITLKSHREWYRGVEDDPTQLFLVAEALETGEPIGTIGLTNIGRGRAEYGRFLIAPEYRGSGFGKDALATLLDYAFGELKLTYVYGDIRAWNEQAINLNIGLGFRSEWIVFRDEDNCDKIRMSITREDWSYGES